MNLRYIKYIVSVILGIFFILVVSVILRMLVILGVSVIIGKDELDTLHLSRQCKKILPTIPVVTRQAKNVGQISVRARH